MCRGGERKAVGRALTKTKPRSSLDYTKQGVDGAPRAVVWWPPASARRSAPSLCRTKVEAEKNQHGKNPATAVSAPHCDGKSLFDFSRPPEASSGIAFKNACVKVDSHPRIPVPAGRTVGRGTSQTSSTMNPAWPQTKRTRRGRGYVRDGCGCTCGCGRVGAHETNTTSRR